MENSSIQILEDALVNHGSTQIVVPLGGTMEQLQDREVQLYIPNLQPMDLPLKRFEHRRFAARPFWQRLVIRGVDSLFPGFYRQYKNRPDEEEAEKIDQKILDIVLDHRVDLHILLNTRGGSVFERDVILELMALSKQTGGESKVYAFLDCQSAGAEIFNRADTRYAMADTHYMMHTSEVNWGIVKSQGTIVHSTIAHLNEFERDGNREQRKSELLQGFIANVPLEKRDQAQNWLAALSVNSRGEVNLSGKELSDFGVLIDKAGSVEDLIKTLGKNIGIKIDPEKISGELGIFLLTVLIQDIIQKKLGAEVAIKVDRSAKKISLLHHSATPEKQALANRVFDEDVKVNQLLLKLFKIISSDK